MSGSENEGFAEFLNEMKWVDYKPEPVNIFKIAGFPRWETVSSNIWAYFFDSTKPHNLNDLFIKSLIEVCKSKDEKFKITDYEQEWNSSVELSQGTNSQNRLDISVIGDSVAFAIENKMDANLYNDLADYKQKIINSSGLDSNNCHAIVFHPHSDLQDNNNNFVYEIDEKLVKFWSKNPKETEKVEPDVIAYNITYDELFAEVFKNLGNYVIDSDPRSLEILKQFYENTSIERKKLMEPKNKKIIDQYWDNVKSPDKVAELYKRTEEFTNTVESLAKSIQDIILNKYEQKEQKERITNSWLFKAFPKKNAMADNWYYYVFLGFVIYDKYKIEFVFGHPSKSTFVKAYKKDDKNQTPVFDYSDKDTGISYTELSIDEISTKIEEELDKFISVVESNIEELKGGN